MYVYLLLYWISAALAAGDLRELLPR